MLLIPGLLSLMLAAAALPDIPEPRFEVSYDQAQNAVMVNNPEPAPYTLSFDFPELENAAVDCGKPCLKVAPAGQTVRLLSFRRKNTDLPWRTSYYYQSRIGDYRAQPERKFVYELPYARGATFLIAQGYNGTFSHQDRFALDFLMPQGTPIHAARAGKAVWVVEHFNAGGN
ncbi:MAG TPA: hypothetical protein V6D23_05180 [Candidatus Obscuribacterales bacterium]